MTICPETDPKSRPSQIPSLEQACAFKGCLTALVKEFQAQQSAEASPYDLVFFMLRSAPP